MPQDIPQEASETFAFTPPSLSALDGAPSFTLRAATGREKRQHRRLTIEEGLQHHDGDALRREILAGVKALWTPEAFAEHEPRITAYWEARDAYALQLKDDPKLVWTYDEDEERAITELTGKVAQAWAPLRRMMANNTDFTDQSLLIMVAVVVKAWSALDAKRDLDRGYLTIDSAEAVQEALWALEEKHQADHALKPGTAWQELTVACTRRMYLDEEEVGNSASPSPSRMTPAPSSPTSTSDADGSSPASTAPSTETPATA